VSFQGKNRSKVITSIQIEIAIPGTAGDFYYFEDFI